MKLTSLGLICCLLMSLKISAQWQLLDSIRNAQPELLSESENMLLVPEYRTWKEFTERVKDSSVPLRILHVGGSHVQAGFFTGRLKQHLQQLFKDSLPSPSLIFPYHLAGTNNPLHYRIEGNRKSWTGRRSPLSYHEGSWGLMGISAVLEESSDTLCIQANYKSSGTEERFDRMRFLLDSLPLEIELSWARPDLINEVVTNKEKGYIDIFLNESVTESEVVITQKIPGSFVIRGIELGKEESRVSYIAAGTNGARFVSLDRCEDWFSELALYPSDLIILAIGTNDAYVRDFNGELFEERYRFWIERIQLEHPKTAILLVVPNDAYYKNKFANPATSRQRDIIMKLASEYQTAVWDLYSLMGGLGSSNTWLQAGLMHTDRLHFSITGYEVLADLLMEAFLKNWQMSFPEGEYNPLATHTP